MGALFDGAYEPGRGVGLLALLRAVQAAHHELRELAVDDRALGLLQTGAILVGPDREQAHVRLEMVGEHDDVMNLRILEILPDLFVRGGVEQSLELFHCQFLELH